MTAEEIVLGGYKNFAEGDMEALAKIYHPECKITINGNHSLSGTYVGFQSFLENVLANLDNVWPGFNLDIEKSFRPLETKLIISFLLDLGCMNSGFSNKFSIWV